MLADENRAGENACAQSSDQEAAWKDMVHELDDVLDDLPQKDRQILLQRFYEGKKFKEIASLNGHTAAACKMRVKRALQRVSTMLSARGMTFSTTILATGLGSELSQAAPAATMTAIAPQALSASSFVPFTKVVANTCQTMSSLKSSALAVASVLVVAAVPYMQQQAEADQMRLEIQGIHRQMTGLTDPSKGQQPRPAQDDLGQRAALSQPAIERALPAVARRSRRPEFRARFRAATPSLTASGILASLDAPTDSNGIFRALLAAEKHEPLEAMMASYRIAMMSTDEIKKLLDDLRNFACPKYQKDRLESSILDNGPNLPHRDRLEILVARGGEKSGEAIQNWAESEPEAARDWYVQKRASGELDPGLSSAMHRQMLTDLIRGMADTSPEMALDLYHEMPREEMDSQIVKKLGLDLAEYLLTTGDDNFLSQMLEYHGEEDRRKALEGVFWEFASVGEYDAGLAWVEKYHPNPEERVHYFGRMFNDVIVYQSPDILEWLGTTVTEREGPEIVGRVIAVNQGRRTEAKEWLERQSPGAMRDHGYAGLVEHLLDFKHFEEALAHTERIDDAALRVGSERLAAQRWLARDREGAEKALPVALRDQGYAGLVESRLEAGLFKKALDDAGRIDDATLRGTSQQMIGRQWLERERAEAEQGLPAELLQQLQNQ